MPKADPKGEWPGDYTYFVLFLLLADVVEKLVDLLCGAKTMGFPFSV